MAGLIEKVVRVEELVTTDVERTDSLLATPDVSGHDVTKGSVLPVTVSREVDQISADEELEVAEDSNKVVALPDGWPNIPKLQEKQSWDYSTVISPSVNKATSHLELLQTVIEEWVKENRSERTSRAGSRRTRSSVHHGHSGSRQQISFSSGSHGPVDSSVGSSQLSIHGVGGQRGEKKTQMVETIPEEDYDLPYLGAEEVIDEVITLLAKIETDRTETLAGLKAERERVTMLRTKIDNLAMKRLTDLPVAVQKEHEDCAMDISELNWHVSYRGRILDRNNSRVSVADTLNTRLKEDIAFVNKHIPLVKEKLDLEVDAMDRIQQAQLDTNEELDVTLQRCSKVEEKSGETNAKAEQERNAIKKDLDSVTADLNYLNQELSDAKMTYNSYTHKCNAYRQQLQDNDQELVLLLVKDENVKAAEAIQATKVWELEAEIKQREIEHRTLDDENISLQDKLDTNHAKFTKKEHELRAYIDKKTEMLRQLTRQNDEMSMDVEDLENKVKDCDKQKTADEKNLERMRKELDRTEEQISQAKDELANVSIINNAVRDQLQKEEDRCMQAEEALRATTEGLKKQVKEEIHSRTVLIARIQTDSTDLINAREEAKIKKKMIDKKVSEVNNAVKNILGKVEKLRSFHMEKTKIIAHINEELTKISEIKKDVGQTCEQKRSELLSKHKKQKEVLLGLEKRLDHMVWKTDMVTKKVKEMDESSVMMDKSVTKTQKMITQLEADYEELNIQIETGEKMEAELKANLTKTTERVSESETQHADHMRDRNKVLQDHEKSLEYNIALNKQLAAKYRSLQNKYVAVKSKMLDKFEERVRMENAIKDLKQLKSLQMRMHAALMEYFKYRGLYNQGELGRMEQESHSNTAKVNDLQGQMDSVLDKMTHFLKHQVDGDTIRKMAMEKVDEEEKRISAKPEIVVPTPGTHVQPPISVV